MKPITSSEPENSEESERRAAAADAADRPLEPEIVGDPSNPQVHIDPKQIHGLILQTIKGLVLRIDYALGWERHPDDAWCETTTQCVEILLDKYFGMSMGPEAALIVQLGSHTIENVDLFSEPAAKEGEKKPDESQQKTAA